MKPEDVNLLREALPFINRFYGKVFVVKFGGEVADESSVLRAFCEEVALCFRVGIRVVLVHGGGRQATELQEKLGLEPRIIDGRRVTDDQTLEVVKMVFAGKLNTDVLLALRRAGVDAVGLSGVDGGLLDAVRRPPQVITDAKTGKKETVDFGLVGDIRNVEPGVLLTLLDRGYLPAVCSLAADDDGNVYNVNADTVATRIAAKVQCEKLILASGVDGIVGPTGKVLSRLTLREARRLIPEGIVTGGMIPKVQNACEAIQAGVRSVHIINGTRSGSLLEEVFTEGGAGTMIVEDGMGSA